MRTRINNITFTPGTRSINTGITDLTVDDIRLFINESQMKVICSSMQKGNIDSISSGVVTYKDTFPVLGSGDHITFEIDKGDDVAKKSDIPSVASIQNGLAKTTDLPTDYAKAGSGTNVTNTDIKNALTDNSTGLSAISGRMGQAPVGSSKSTLFAYLASIWNSMEGQQQEELPEGLADRVALLLQFFGIAGSFEAEGVGHEQTDNPVINECKTRYAEIFEDLLPSDFVMPNSVTIDGTTYTGTVS